MEGIKSIHKGKKMERSKWEIGSKTFFQIRCTNKNLKMESLLSLHTYTLLHMVCITCTKYKYMCVYVKYIKKV